MIFVRVKLKNSEEELLLLVSDKEPWRESKDHIEKLYRDSIAYLDFPSEEEVFSSVGGGTVVVTDVFR